MPWSHLIIVHGPAIIPYPLSSLLVSQGLGAWHRRYILITFPILPQTGLTAPLETKLDGSCGTWPPARVSSFCCQKVVLIAATVVNIISIAFAHV